MWTFRDSCWLTCRNPGSNQGPLDLQSNALPIELFRHQKTTKVNKTNLDLLQSRITLTLKLPGSIGLTLSQQHIQMKNYFGIAVWKSCRNPGSNRGPLDLQSNALPTELFRHRKTMKVNKTNHIQAVYFVKSYNRFVQPALKINSWRMWNLSG